MNDSKKDPNRDMPPVPRDYQKASHSEIIPLKSKSINVLKSPLFYMVMLTGFATMAMFGYMEEYVFSKKGIDKETFIALVNVAVAYMLALVLLIVYLYSRSDRPFWHFMVNFAFVSVVLFVPDLFEIYAIPFNDLKDTLKLNGNNSVISIWIGQFIAVGLTEELIKATLVLIGAYLTFKAARGKNSPPESILNVIRIRGPLDGLMMGIFGGAGFIMLETGAGSGYVLNNAQSWAEELAVIWTKEGKNPNPEWGWGAAHGLMLLFPRVMGGMVGHMAYAGINGYFIGLSVIRPKQALKLLLMGWVGAAALHATWNTGGTAFSYLSILVGGVFLVACLLKARQLERFQGRSVDSYGSIVVKPAQRIQGSANSAGKDVQEQQPAQASLTRQSIRQPTVSTVLGLAISGAVIPVEQGKILNLGSVAELGSRGAGIVGKFTSHPTRENVLGIKNLGAEPWTAHLRDNTEQRVEPQRNIRLAPGVKIDFGRGLQAEVVVL